LIHLGIQDVDILTVNSTDVFPVLVVRNGDSVVLLVYTVTYLMYCELLQRLINGKEGWPIYRQHNLHPHYLLILLEMQDAEILTGNSTDALLELAVRNGDSVAFLVYIVTHLIQTYYLLILLEMQDAVMLIRKYMYAFLELAVQNGDSVAFLVYIVIHLMDCLIIAIQYLKRLETLCKRLKILCQVLHLDIVL
jgi:hypothetical protein